MNYKLLENFDNYVSLFLLPLALMQALVLYVMGVSGSGKTTVGKLLSERTGIPFFDGDDFHPKKNVRKMASGRPLNDNDRRGWLETLNLLAKKEMKNKGAIIACSALKKSYRKILNKELADHSFFIFLKGDFEMIQKRMEQRKGHFMPAELLKSQFDDLETPEGAMVFDIENKPEEIVAGIIKVLS